MIDLQAFNTARSFCMLLLIQLPATLSSQNFRRGEHCVKIMVNARIPTTALNVVRVMRNLFNAILLGNSRMIKRATEILEIMVDDT